MKVLGIVFLLLINSYVYEGQVLYIYDGDTILVHKPKDENVYKVRLYGIDACEIQQEYGKEAKDYLTKILLNQNVKVVVQNMDYYGREVANIYLDGRWINKELVMYGYAHFYSKYSNDSELLQAQKYAMINKLGIWKNGNRVTIPEDFRKFNNSYKKSNYEFKQ